MSLLIGSGVKAGVVGGLVPFEDDFAPSHRQRERPCSRERRGHPDERR